jgi:hypothetical protein
LPLQSVVARLAGQLVPGRQIAGVDDFLSEIRNDAPAYDIARREELISF